MNIRLRQLKNKNGTVSLRLDAFLGYYTDAQGKRKAKRIRETLPFHIPPVEDANYSTERDRLLQKADAIRQKKELQLQRDGAYPFSEKETKKAFFLPYLETMVSIKISNKKNNEAVWMGMQRWYKVFASPIIQFKSINEKHCAAFYTFLKNEAKKSNGTPLAMSTVRLYYQKFHAIVQQAYLDGNIPTVPSQPVAFKTAEIKHKTVLKEYEVIALRNAPYSNADVKYAFLMAVEMGFKLGHLRSMTWGDIRHEREEWYVKMKTKNTTKPYFYPIPDYVKQFLGEPQKNTKLLFPLLRSASEANVQLLKWVVQAGIARHITFECARNTFAYNKVMNSTPIDKIQLYLGHQNLRTTEKFIEQLQIDLPKNISKNIKRPAKVVTPTFTPSKRQMASHIKEKLSLYSYQF